MTFLKGTTTWGDLRDKIVALVCGEVADDYGVTASSTHKWRRMASGQPVVAPPSSTDHTITQEHRSGYWLRVDDTGFQANRLSAALAWCKTTAISTGTWNANNQSLHVSLRVVSSNTVAGNYSNATVYWYVQYATTTSAGSLTGSNSVTLNASGVGTFTYSGITFTVQLGDPSGILPANACFWRWFTPTYRGGIDTWRGYGRATSAPSYSVAPSGTSGTDYDPVSLLIRKNGLTNSDSYLAVPRMVESATPTSYGYAYPGGFEQGMGIKTNTALTGNRYVVSFSASNALHALIYAGGTAANSSRLNAIYGGLGVDPTDGSTQYGASGYNRCTNTYDTGYAFLRPFPNTTVATAGVEYWISVTPKHIAIALNGSSTYSGYTTLNEIAEITQLESIPGRGKTWFVGAHTEPNLPAFSDVRPYYRWGPHPLAAKISTVGVRDGGRDWQTGSGRCDIFVNTRASIWHQSMGFLGEVLYPTSLYSYQNDGLFTGTYFPVPAVRTPTVVSTFESEMAFMTPFPWNYSDSASNSGADAYIANYSRPEGIVDHGIFVLGQGGWAEGDELTDTVTGKKYMLFKASARTGVAYSSSDTFWGLALEEA